jgi:hypothetical protein
LAALPEDIRKELLLESQCKLAPATTAAAGAKSTPEKPQAKPGRPKKTNSPATSATKTAKPVVGLQVPPAIARQSGLCQNCDANTATEDCRDCDSVYCGVCAGPLHCRPEMCSHFRVPLRDEPLPPTRLFGSLVVLFR